MTTLAAPARSLPLMRQAGAARRGKLVRAVLLYGLLLLISAFFVAPLLWMISTSLKAPSEYFTADVRWVPRNPTLQHYQQLLDPSESAQAPVRLWFLNSLIISTTVTILTVAVDALAAYAYARMDFPGRGLLFSLLLLTLFLPPLMFLIPNFITVYNLGLLNSFPAVILPALAGVFGVFMLRQFFLDLPVELEEAAYLDGANTLQTFVYVVLPMARGALATLAIITFLASWNDFLWPLLVLSDTEKQTVQVGLRTLQGAYISNYGLVMAGAVLVAAPVLLLYVVLQRYIVRSVATTGLKV
jgi:multiple sugar transport system permease protein